MCVAAQCTCAGVNTCCDGCAPRGEGSLCEDDNPCTTANRCVQGVCASGEPVECPAADACHKKGICNSDSGECEQEQLLEGTPCDDGESCTRDDRCTAAGLCAGTQIPNCAGGDDTATSEDVEVADVVETMPDSITLADADAHGTQVDGFIADGVATTGQDSSEPEPQAPVDQASSGCTMVQRGSLSGNGGLLIVIMVVAVVVVFRRRWGKQWTGDE